MMVVSLEGINKEVDLIFEVCREGDIAANDR
jgi:hypothetical protein